jgi:hypothetical protein
MCSGSPVLGNLDLPCCCPRRTVSPPPGAGEPQARCRPDHPVFRRRRHDGAAQYPYHAGWSSREIVPQYSKQWYVVLSALMVLLPMHVTDT